jgi:hypothetical protein
MNYLTAMLVLWGSIVALSFAATVLIVVVDSRLEPWVYATQGAAPAKASEGGSASSRECSGGSELVVVKSSGAEALKAAQHPGKVTGC